MQRKLRKGLFLSIFSYRTKLIFFVAFLLVMAICGYGFFQLVLAAITFTEDFTAITYKDVTNTTGKWDTVLGQARLLGNDWVNMIETKDSADNVSNNSGNSVPSIMNLDSAGNPSIVWSDDSTGNGDIYFKKWTPAVNAWTKMDGSVGFDNIAPFPGEISDLDYNLNSSSIPYVVWVDSTSGTRNIYFTKWSTGLAPGICSGGATACWTNMNGSRSSFNITNNNKINQFSSFQIYNDNPYVVFMHGFTVPYEIYFTKWTPTACGGTGCWTTMAGNKICQGGNNAGNVCTADTDCSSGGGICRGYENISKTLTDSGLPLLAIDSIGRPMVVWHEGTSGQEVFFTRWNPTTQKWTNMSGGSAGWENISNTSRESVYPKIAINSANQPIVVWQETIGLGNEIDAVITRWDGSKWAKFSNGTAGFDNISNNPGWSSNPIMRIDNNGYPHVVWADFGGVGGNRDIYYTRWSGTSWTRANGSTPGYDDLSNDPNDSIYQFIEVDSNNIPYIDWTDSGISSAAHLTKWTPTACGGTGCWTKMDGITAGHDIKSGYVQNVQCFKPNVKIYNNIINFVWNDVGLGGNTDVYFSKWLPTYKSSSVIQSLKINNPPPTIKKVILTPNETLNSQTIDYFLSNDGGTSWEPATLGPSTHVFSALGSDLRWRADLSTSNTLVTPIINDLQIDMNNLPIWNPQTVSIGMIELQVYNADNGTMTDADIGDTLTCSLSSTTCGFITGANVTTNGPNCHLNFTAPAGPGICQVVLKATDNGTPFGETDSNSIIVSWNTNAPPAIETAAPTTAKEGTAYNYNPITITDATIPADTISCLRSAGDTCGGVITDTPGASPHNCSYSFTPDDSVQNCTVGIRADDGTSYTDQDTVVTINRLPDWSIQPTNINIYETEVYDADNGTMADLDLPAQTLTCSQASTTCNPVTMPITVSNSSSTNCHIQFTAPPGSGTCNLTLKSTDTGTPAGDTDSNLITITWADNPSPIITSVVPITAVEGTQYVYTITATDASPGETLYCATIVSDPIFPLLEDTCLGMVTDASGPSPHTCTYTFTPGNSLATCKVGVKVTDQIGQRANQNSVVTINRLPAWNTQPIAISLNFGETYNSDNGIMEDLFDPAQTLTCSQASTTCGFPITVTGAGPSGGTNCHLQFTANHPSCNVILQATDSGTPAGIRNSSTIDITVIGGGAVLPVPPTSPIDLNCEAISPDTIRWNFTDTASDETGFRLYGPEGKIYDTGDFITQDLSYIEEINLLPNTQYVDRYVTAFNGTLESAPSNTASCYTLANTPLMPEVLKITNNSVIIKINSGDNNPSDTEYAIIELISNQYIQPDGNFSYSEIWDDYLGWGGDSGLEIDGSLLAEPPTQPDALIGNENLNINTNESYNAAFKIALASGQNFQFAAKARNGDGVETTFSGTTNGSTTGSGSGSGTLAPKIGVIKGVGINLALNNQSDTGLIKVARAYDELIPKVTTTGERMLLFLQQFFIFLLILLILFILLLILGLHGAIKNLNQGLKPKDKIKLIWHLITKEPALVFLRQAPKDHSGTYQISYEQHKKMHTLSQKNFRRILGLAIIDIIILIVLISALNHNSGAQGAPYNQSGQEVKTGDKLSYIIEVGNSGNLIAGNVQVTDNLNSNLDYETGSAKIVKGSQTITSGITAAGSNLSFNVGDLNIGQSAAIYFTATVKSGSEGQTITNTATSSGSNFTTAASNTTSNLVAVSEEIPVEEAKAICGNGKVETGEQCDDGNLTNDDGCSATCQNEAEVPPLPEPIPGKAICGNSIIEIGEQCDDGNTVSNDGCSAACQNDAEVPPLPEEPVPPPVPPTPPVPPVPPLIPLIPPKTPIIGPITEEINKNETVQYLQQNIIDNPQVEQFSQNVIMPALLVIALANTIPSAIILTAGLLPYLHLLFVEPFLWLFRKKRKKWGVVYDSLSKLPVGLAVVRLYNKADNKLVQTKVTDTEGRYLLIVKEPGKYYLGVNKVDYEYPTKFLQNDKEDTKYLDLYHGEAIEVKAKDSVITANIPLDPKDKRVLTEKEAVRSYLLKNTRLIVSFVGMILSLLVVLIYPTVLTILALAIHVVLYFIFRKLIVPPKPKSWGIVYDQKNKQPLSYAVVRIFETKFNKLLETQVTDGHGRYSFLVGKNQYQLLTEKQGYQKKEIKPVDLIKNEKIINLDVGLNKI